MASFSLDFPDDDVLDVLGDDIEVIDTSGNVTPIRGVFDFEFMSDELGGEIDIKYPTVEVNDELSSLFKKNIKVKFNNTTYSYESKQPGDVGKTIIILRSKL